MTQIVKGISFDPDIFEALEKLRGNSAQFRSVFINKLIRKELGMVKR